MTYRDKSTKFYRNPEFCRVSVDESRAGKVKRNCRAALSKDAGARWNITVGPQ